MTRGHRTEDRRQMVVGRIAARFQKLRGKAAKKRDEGEFRGSAKTQSSVPGPQSSERGFSLVSAIFLLVVIAVLGTFAVTLSTTQQLSSALDVQGARAYQAARAGIEWGAYQALRNNSCAASTTLAALPNTLANFSVTVDCGSTAATEAGVTVTMYQLTSIATQGTAATADYVERQMSVTLAQCSIAGVPQPCT